MICNRFLVSVAFWGLNGTSDVGIPCGHFLVCTDSPQHATRVSRWLANPTLRHSIELFVPPPPIIEASSLLISPPNFHSQSRVDSISQALKMHSHHLVLTLAGLITIGSSSPVDQTPLLSSVPLLPETARCDCTGTNDTGETGRAYICRDPRLGPKVLPRRFPFLSVVSDYDRFGGETPGVFLQQWTDAKGNFKYPPHNGFQLNTAGEPILGNLTLQVGTKVDRFGSEYGAYVSAADAPYSQRALPPNNLDTNPNTPDYPYGYHIYEVLKPLEVEGGPIAPWFGQPGLGAQFWVGATGNILTLVDLGYLAKVNKSEVVWGPGRGNRCG